MMPQQQLGQVGAVKVIPLLDGHKLKKKYLRTKVIGFLPEMMTWDYKGANI